MTISSTTRKAGPFTGTGLQTDFPFTFKVFAAADLMAVQAVTATGAETIKVFTTDYTVVLNPDQNASPGGTLTMLVAPPVGETLTLTSQVANTQGTDLTNAGGFYPAVINSALDKLTILIQQLAEKVSRAVQVTISSGTNPADLIAALFTASESAAASASASSTSADAANSAAGASSASAAAAAASAASTGLPILTGKALNTLRVKADESGYETRTPTQTRADIGAAKAGADDTITSLTGLIGPGLLPVGTIIHVPQTSAPTGYLKANGALLSRTTYAGLYAVAVASGNMAASDGAWVAGQFSPGDGSTTFRIPDARGEFLRSWDDGRGVDSGRAIGTAQADELKSHAHASSALSSADSRPVGGGASESATAGSQTGATGGSETRPRNIALLACIKF